MRMITSITVAGWVALCSGSGYGQTTQPAATTRSNAPSRSVPFDVDHWHLSDGAEIVFLGGRTALTGTAYVKDASLLNGTIEADVWITGEVKFAGFTFRVQSFDEYEWCWLRTHKTNGLVQDGVQYAPAFRGVPCWQLNGGPGGIAPVNVPKNEWVHMKMEILDDSAALYVSDMTKPAMVIDQLQLGLKRGSVGLRTTVRGGVYFSNFAYRPAESSAPIPAKEKVIPPTVLTQWQLSPSYPIPSVDVVPTYPVRPLAEIKSWITPEVDVSGLVNITRYHGTQYHARTATVAGRPDCAILRTSIDARENRQVRLNFGYSDAVTIFLNRTPLFWGNSAFLSRNKADGEWISYNDAVFLNLKKGRNELLVIVAEDFGGWGFQARLDNAEGIEVHSD
jgi:hypothetical protein